MIYASLITATGWTYEYIDKHMDLFRFRALLEYWTDHPPQHLQLSLLVDIVAALGGVKLPGRGGGTDASNFPPELLAGEGVKLEIPRRG